MRAPDDARAQRHEADTLSLRCPCGPLVGSAVASEVDCRRGSSTMVVVIHNQVTVGCRSTSLRSHAGVAAALVTCPLCGSSLRRPSLEWGGRWGATSSAYAAWPRWRRLRVATTYSPQGNSAAQARCGARLCAVRTDVSRTASRRVCAPASVRRAQWCARTKQLTAPDPGTAPTDQEVRVRLLVAVSV